MNSTWTTCIKELQQINTSKQKVTVITSSINLLVQCCTASTTYLTSQPCHLLHNSINMAR